MCRVSFSHFLKNFDSHQEVLVGGKSVIEGVSQLLVRTMGR
jgi:hypothetical protein